MNRWTHLLFALLAVGLSSTAGAQTDEPKPNIRQFPKEARRGELAVLTAPEIAIDNRPDRLSPAVRIRDVNHKLVLSGTLANQRLVVNYLRDNTGLVHNVWILNAEETRQKMPGQTEGILSNIRSMFDTPTVTDDGKTPFNQLPKYRQ
jgi:hypothetical protein